MWLLFDWLRGLVNRNQLAFEAFWLGLGHYFGFLLPLGQLVFGCVLIQLWNALAPKATPILWRWLREPIKLYQNVSFALFIRYTWLDLLDLSLPSLQLSLLRTWAYPVLIELTELILIHKRPFHIQNVLVKSLGFRRRNKLGQ